MDYNPYSPPTNESISAVTPELPHPRLGRVASLSLGILALVLSALILLISYRVDRLTEVADPSTHCFTFSLFFSLLGTFGGICLIYYARRSPRWLEP